MSLVKSLFEQKLPFVAGMFTLAVAVLMFVLSAEFDFHLKDDILHAQAHGFVQAAEAGIAAVSSDHDWPVNSWLPYCAFAGMGNGS